MSDVAHQESPAEQGLSQSLTEHYLQLNPAAVYSRSLYERTRNVIEGAKTDIRESETKCADLAWGIGTIATQAADRFRISLILAPEAALRAFEHTDKSIAAGAAAAGVFMLWNGTMGEVLTQTLSRFKKGTESFEENFPAIVSLFTDSLAGIESSEQRALATETVVDKKVHFERLLSIGKTATTHVRRAMSGLGLGSTAFVATAAVNDYTKEEVREQNAAVTLDTGVAIFGIGWGLAGYINSLAEQGELERAQDILNVVDNNWVWYSIAGASMVMEFASARHRAKKLKEAAEATTVKE